ncbi:helix-turn-helix domain-containing protein [Fischerella sp. PCC 9605]|uniref:helix-turn-helix domain-containing protein n=1 Tax=Fischerella sp. PCC 9605 TaxID=1173024 RepID=UPI0004AFFFE9|nr:helix-turn-helix transcriptional regulator [Fischerella sp. PCC 9605]
MQSSNQNTKLKKIAGLRQPEVSKLIRELRQLTTLTQEQLATVLGVAYGTINRWENGHMQPSPLALKQIKAVLEDLGNSPEPELQKRGKDLLVKYFLEAE